MSHDTTDDAKLDLAAGNRVSNRRATFQKRAVNYTAALVSLAVFVWVALTQYDRYHPAAPFARALWSWRPSDRLNAVHELEQHGRVDPSIAIPALVASLRDSIPEVRASSAMALVSVVPGVAGEEEPSNDLIEDALKQLIRLMDDSEADVRTAATRAAWMVAIVRPRPSELLDPQPMTRALLAHFGDPDSSVRQAAIQGLGVVGPRAADDPPLALLAAVETESDKLREAAVKSLISYRKGLPKLIPSIIGSLEKASPPTRRAYFTILSEIQPPAFSNDAVPGLVRALASHDMEVRALAATKLIPFHPSGDDTVSALLAALNATAKDQPNTPPAVMDPPAPDYVIPIVDSISQVGLDLSSSIKALPALGALLKSSGPMRQVAVAKALRRFGPSPDLFRLLTEDLRAKDDVVKVAILWAIHDIDFAESYTVPPVIGELLDAQSAEVRAAAAAAIHHAGLGVDRYIAALLQHAEYDPSEEVRSTCGTVLGVLRPPRITAAAVPVVIPALASSDGAVRIQSSRLLGALGPQAVVAVPALIRATKEPAPKQMWGDDQIEAAEALSRIAPGTVQADEAARAVVGLFLSSPERQPGLINLVAAFGPRSAATIPRLKELTEHKASYVRENAAKALARIEGAK